jgi:hypothetical protein
MFNDLIPGSYNLKFDLPAPTPQFSYHFTEQDQGSDETKDSDADKDTGITVSTDLVSGENDITWDAGIYKKAEEAAGQVKLGNLVWIEDDNDGDATTGLITYPPAGTTITVTGSGGVAQTTTTDAYGHYELWVDENDTYMVTVDVPSYLIPTAGSGDSSITDPTSEDNHSHDAHGTTVSITVVDNMSVDFGFTLPPHAHIGDYFWIDKNGDGVQNSDEAPVIGATVELFYDDGTPAKDIYGKHTQSTDDKGKYGFDVAPGNTYRIHFIIPDKWKDDKYTFTDPNAGGNDEKDSDVDSNGYTASVTPLNGDVITTLDAGILSCQCSGIESDSIDAFNKIFGLIFVFAVFFMGAIMQRKEENQTAGY